jgi:hypothetical protein
MLKLILIALILLIIVALILAALKPNRFSVSRSINIKALPGKIFPHINSFRAWATWSPWEKIDPNCQRSYSGAESGVGAIYGWSGNKDVGEGSMEIVESVPSSKIVMNLDFIKPYEGHSTVEFLFEPQDDGTLVTQTMVGESKFFQKLICMFINMDKIIGAKYEQGLSSLKASAEK